MDMILIDLQKAFDNWDQKILLHKINCIVSPDNAVKYFHSYLTSRAFFVLISTAISEAGTINCRVPQWSILGPLLFLLYILFCRLCQILIHTCMYMTQVSFIIKGKLTRSKTFSMMNLHMYGIGLLIIIYQFILVKIKLNSFFSVLWIKTYLSLTNISGRIHYVEANLRAESMAMKPSRKINMLQFLHGQDEFLHSKLFRLLCYSLIQSHFHYVYIPLYS